MIFLRNDAYEYLAEITFCLCCLCTRNVNEIIVRKLLSTVMSQNNSFYEIKMIKVNHHNNDNSKIAFLREQGSDSGAFIYIKWYFTGSEFSLKLRN